MNIDENQTKPAILEGLAEWLRHFSDSEPFGMNAPVLRWADEVEQIQAALTQVGEEG